MIVVILLLLQFSLLFLRPSFTITLEEKKSFKIACRQGNIGVLSSLFCVLDPSFDENYAIRFGCKKGCLDAVKFLLSLPRVNPMAKENAPLILAAKHGHDLIVNLLLQEDRINPAEPDNEALITACLGGHTKVVRVLLSDNRINAAARFNMPLIIACQHGFTDIVSLLLQTARVDSTFPNGEPLKIAIQNGHNNIVEILQGNRLDFYDAISFLPQINFNTGESSAECSINEEHDEPFNFGSPAFKPWIENHLPRHNLIKRSLILNGVPLNLIGNEPLMVIYEEFRFLIMDAPTIYTIRFYIRVLRKISISS